MHTDTTHKAGENKRAENIIWNASGNYSFVPEYKIFHENGSADIYLNYVIGAVRKYYDYAKLEAFFNYLKIDSDYEFYRELFWLGLENSVFEKSKNNRPALKDLRKIHAENIVFNEPHLAENTILNKMRKAHYQNVLGIEISIENRLMNLLNELEFDERMTTDEIISKMNDILDKYFKFNAGHYEKSFKKYEEHKKDSENIKKNFEKFKEQHEGNPLMKDLEIESAETARTVHFEYSDDIKNVDFQLYRLNNRKVDTDKSYIEKYYGKPVLSEKSTLLLEKALCTDNHKNNHLYFTKGEYVSSIDADTAYIKKIASERRDANINFYYDNYASNMNSIISLTNKIRNTMIVNFEHSRVKASEGKFSADKAWRLIHVNDGNVFTKELKNDLGNITVDILLDSSASQHERQEIIASQAYIIAESLTRCHIPVKVYSFCSLRTYTIINLHRDYEEWDKNDSIFNYRTSGCNRDGLAVRTSVHMMGDNESEHKILIVLSDCKPNDIETNPGTGIIPSHIEYSGIKAVMDTAMEVKKGLFRGYSVLCVFTGNNEDIISTKKIYGHNFVRIKSLERFSDTVGLMLQNQLKNL